MIVLGRDHEGIKRDTVFDIGTFVVANSIEIDGEFLVCNGLGRNRGGIGDRFNGMNPPLALLALLLV